jgi:hypothetical protein
MIGSHTAIPSCTCVRCTSVERDRLRTALIEIIDTFDAAVRALEPFVATAARVPSVSDSDFLIGTGPSGVTIPLPVTQFRAAEDAYRQLLKERGRLTALRYAG